MHMHTTRINSEQTAVVFDPSIKELSVTCGERFFFNFDSQQFEIDTNPHGDPQCIPIADLAVLNHSLQYTLQAEEQTVIALSSPLDVGILTALVALNGSGFLYDHHDTTKIDILTEKGRVKSVRLIKIVDYSSKDFLTFLFEETQAVVIKYPFEKLPLNSIHVEDDNIICETAEETIVWEAKLPSPAVNLIKYVFGHALQSAAL